MFNLTRFSFTNPGTAINQSLTQPTELKTSSKKPSGSARNTQENLSKETSCLSSGSPSKVQLTQFVPSVPLNVITSQDLNQIVLQTSDNLTQAKRVEHRAVQRVFNSLSQGSLQKGHHHQYVIRRPDRIIRGLVNAGLLPSYAEMGRQDFLGLTAFERTAINTPIWYLESHKEEIMDWIEDNTDDEPEEVFRILQAGSIIGASTGAYECMSEAVNRLAGRLNALPSGKARMAVLRNPGSLVALISAN